MFTAWLRYAVTNYCFEYRRLPAKKRAELLPELAAVFSSTAGVEGFADLVVDRRHNQADVNEAADTIARGLALLALHNRDLAHAGGSPEHLADVHLFGETFNAAALIRERCDRLAADNERACELRAAGYREPDWDRLADAYVDGADEWVSAAIRYAYCGGPLLGCQIADLLGDELPAAAASLSEAA
jgi:hypothetical protein